MIRVQYGAGLLPLVPQELFAIPEEEEKPKFSSKIPGGRSLPRKRGSVSPEKDLRLDYLKEVAALGLSLCFREVVLDGVVELNCKDGAVTTRWLQGRDAEVIIAAAEQLGGMAPYSALPKGVDADFYFPAFGIHSRGVDIRLPRLEARCHVAPLNQNAQVLKRNITQGEPVDMEFRRELADAAMVCVQHRLILHLAF